MAVKRYFAIKDNSITNAFRDGLTLRGTGSNMGQSDVLETFSLYGQESSSSAELQRILIEFDINEIINDRNNSLIPASGSVSFFLNLYNARHSDTLPRDYTLNVLAVSQSWQEGIGMDMEDYSDLTYDKLGSNWIRRSGSTSWDTIGGDFHAAPVYSATFPVGNEDLSVDVSGLVEEWIKGAGSGGKENYGFGVKLPPNLEAYFSSSTGANVSPNIHNPGGSTFSYYTKKFFGRGTEFWFKRPKIEARWDSRTKDDRGNFYASSSLAPAADNLNTLFLYNFVRGRLTNIPAIGTGEIFVDLYETLGESALTQCIDTPATGGYVSTGIYSCSVCVDSTATTLRDVWYSGSVEYHTGSISVINLNSSNFNKTGKYVVNITNLKNEYYSDQTNRFRLFAREKDWSPNIFTVAQSTVTNLIFESASYQISRVVDDEIIVAYGTGSTNHTLLSYDVSGNYFDLDMSMLEPDYSYRINISVYEDSLSSYVEQANTFKFKVSKYEY